MMMFNQLVYPLLTICQQLKLKLDVLPVDGELYHLVITYIKIRKIVSNFKKLHSLQLGGSATNNLQYVRVPAITNAQCNAAYGGSITDTMICAGYPGVGGKDACQGDSGGPFVCNDNGNAVIAGVVSWGNGCALADYPGVYARTTSALSWIQNSMVSFLKFLLIY